MPPSGQNHPEGTSPFVRAIRFGVDSPVVNVHEHAHSLGRRSAGRDACRGVMVNALTMARHRAAEGLKAVA
jgi:hypothetical protein